MRWYRSEWEEKKLRGGTDFRGAFEVSRGAETHP